MGAQASSPAECNEEQERCMERDELRRAPKTLGVRAARLTWERRRPRLRNAADGRALVISRDVRRETYSGVT